MKRALSKDFSRVSDAAHVQRLRSLLLPSMDFLRSDDITITTSENQTAELSRTRRDHATLPVEEKLSSEQFPVY